MRHPLNWLRATVYRTRVHSPAPFSLLIAFLAFVFAGSGSQSEAATLQFTRVRATGFDGGGALDPVSGKFYERSTIDATAVIRIYNTSAAFESGTPSSNLTLTPGGFGTYFAAQNGKIIGRSTSGTTELRQWSGSSGQAEVLVPSVAAMGGVNGNHTFNWGGYTAVNVINDDGQLYIVGAKLDFSGFMVVKLNPDLTVASTRDVAISYSQGFAFIVRGKLFIGSNAVTPTIQRVVDLGTGQLTLVSHSLAGAPNWYVGNAFYDGAADRLYIYNRNGGLYRADQASISLGFLAAPIADAGPDQSTLEGSIVQLTAQNSRDRNVPALPLTYAWTQLSGVPASLASSTTATPTLRAPEVPAAGAVLVFQVSVSNGASNAVTDTVSVSVGNVNFPPIANAGASQTVAENSQVTLNGTGVDSDGDALTLSWTQKSGPPVQLRDADTASPSFVAPAVSFEAGSVDLVFTLVVNDGLVNSGPSDVTIHVMNVNAPPIAQAGANQSVNELEEVALDGTGSTDPDGNALTYQWTQISGEPLGNLSGANTPAATFTAPVLDLGGSSEGTTLTFRLTVSDGELTSVSTMNVRVSNVNHEPIADAGQTRTVPENTLVVLDASGSADTDGDALTYAWEQIDTGFPVVLSDAASVNPTFVTPDVGPAGAVLRFKLTVDDGYGGVASAAVRINVTYANRAPVAKAGPDNSVEEGSTVLLTGNGSDPDGNELQHIWSQVSGPAVTLNNVEGGSATFTAPTVDRTGGLVVLRLTVTDAFGAEDTDDLAVRIVNVNQAPVAKAPANLSVLEGTPVELIGQATDPDAEEQSELVYKWQQIAPTAQLASAGNRLVFVAPVLKGTTADRSINLTFRLTATDPNGSVSSDDVTVTVSRVLAAPVAVASGPGAVDEGTDVTLNGTASNDPDGDVLTYAWVQTAGPAVALHEADTAMPYFTAPFVNGDGTILKFRLTVNDGVSGTSSDEVSVSVKNSNVAPIVDAARPSIETLWPPDHRMVSISILDVIDTNATVRITEVTQNEPTFSEMGGDVANDAIINPDGKSVLLRAERVPNGNGRVYCVRFIASDFEHSVSGVVKVFVPKSKDCKVAEGKVSVNSLSTGKGHTKPAKPGKAKSESHPRRRVGKDSGPESGSSSSNSSGSKGKKNK